MTALLPAFHLASRPCNPDEHVALALETTAAHPSHHRLGGVSRSAPALRWNVAPKLSPDPEDQARRLVAASVGRLPPARGLGA